MGRKLFLVMVVFFGTQPFLFSQVNDTITDIEVGRIIRYLASDSLRGRGNISPELLKASVFIGNEFKKSNLLPLPGLPYYHIPFHPFGGGSTVIMDQLLWNEVKVSPKQFIYLHQAPGSYTGKTLNDFTVIKIDGAFTEDMLEQLPNDSSSLLLWTNQKQSDGKSFFPGTIEMPAEGLRRNVLLVYADKPPATISVTAFPSQYLMTEYNVVAVLPGRSRVNEVIMFSAHYDHVGVYGESGDSIMNGANDNASGTTALLLLAQYFAKRNDNERTIMFCAFAGEEMGLLGSKDFVDNINPDNIIAGINIEMIGVPQYGKNSLFIIGGIYSDLPRFLSKQLKNNRMNIRAEPDREKHLFQRSDNYHFAMKGIPYHTIMGSDDDDGCYHKPCDEVKRIDMANMTRIIKAIAASVKGLVNGEIKPRRINPSAVELKKQ